MSLREKNKNEVALTSDKGTSSLSQTLKNASGITVAKPGGQGARAIQKATRGIVRVTSKGFVGFIIDATDSRRHNWEEAQQAQRRMFGSVSKFGEMHLRLVHFGGGEITDCGWTKDPDAVAAAMAPVECIGGETQIIPSLRKFIDDDSIQGTPCVVVVGDCFEEETSDLDSVAEDLARRGIKVFTFLDGDKECAREAFKRLADKTGGAFAAFSPDMPFEDLCKGVALKAVGGDEALQSLQNAAVKRLLLTARPS